jgi:hypothetical protein
MIDVDPAVTAHASHEAMLDAPNHDLGWPPTVDGLRPWIAEVRARRLPGISVRYIETHGIHAMARDIGIAVDDLEQQLEAWIDIYDGTYLDALEILHLRDRHDRDTSVLTSPEQV